MLYSVIFDRGHGSALDDQFYIELRKGVIARHSYLDRTVGRIMTYEDMPVSDGAWENVMDALSRLELKKKPRRILKKLFSRPVVDGPRYWILYLVTQNGKRTKKTAYLWQHREEYRELELLLEQIAEEARQRESTEDV